ESHARRGVLSSRRFPKGSGFAERRRCRQQQAAYFAVSGTQHCEVGELQGANALRITWQWDEHTSEVLKNRSAPDSQRAYKRRRRSHLLYRYRGGQRSRSTPTSPRSLASHNAGRYKAPFPAVGPLRLKTGGLNHSPSATGPSRSCPLQCFLCATSRKDSE